MCDADKAKLHLSRAATYEFQGEVNVQSIARLLVSSGLLLQKRLSSLHLLIFALSMGERCGDQPLSNHSAHSVRPPIRGLPGPVGTGLLLNAFCRLTLRNLRVELPQLPFGKLACPSVNSETEPPQAQGKIAVQELKIMWLTVI